MKSCLEEDCTPQGYTCIYQDVEKIVHARMLYV